eukprot:1200348-Rhodomonas_salina.2
MSCPSGKPVSLLDRTENLALIAKPAAHDPLPPFRGPGSNSFSVASWRNCRNGRLLPFPAPNHRWWLPSFGNSSLLLGTRCARQQPRSWCRRSCTCKNSHVTQHTSAGRRRGCVSDGMVRAIAAVKLTCREAQGTP